MNSDNRNGKGSEAVTRRTVTIFALCIALIIIITQIDAIENTLRGVIGLLSPVVMGVMFAYIINPLCRIFEHTFLKLFAKSSRLKEKTRIKLARGLSVVLSVFALIAAIALLLFLIIPEFLESVYKFIGIAPDLVRTAGERILAFVEPSNAFGEHLTEAINSLVSTLVGWFGGELSTIIGNLLEGAISVVSFVVNFLIALVICVYALLEKRKFISQIKKLLYALFSPSFANDILDVARYGNTTFAKFISGKLLTSTIVGILTFIFMSVMGMQYSLLSACIIAITNVIPFFGPFIGGIPTAFFVLLTNTRHGIIYIIFLVVLQQIEGNIIEPLIMEDRTGVSKFWITTALLFFGGVFGIVGMIFSVPLVAVLFYIIKIAVNRSLAKKELPLTSAEYTNLESVDTETGEIYTLPAKESAPTLRKLLSAWSEKIRSKRKTSNNEEDSE